MNAKVIRYTTNPESAEENARLVRAVYAELAATRPEGFRYCTFRLEDGVSFVHVAILEGEDNPLATSAAFADFQSGVKDRCIEGPYPSDASVVGEYRFTD